MSKTKIIKNIFSNWAFFILTVLVAFIVSPIMVNQLGDEAYGIWVLMVSIGSYFTVLDFGVNTAIVRFISKYTAVNNYKKAAQIYSSAFIFFVIISVAIIVVMVVLGPYFSEFFNIKTYSKHYLHLVLIIIGVDLAINLTFGVLSGTLRGLQRFLEINIILISTLILKNIILVYLLFNNYSFLSIAILQALTSILKYLLQYLYIKRRYKFLHFQFSGVKKSTFKKIYNYSIYSFLIAIALEMHFYTDSIVIGSMLSLKDVTYYAIPAMIVQHLEKFIWGIIAVLIPIVSSQETIGKAEDNGKLYIIGTKYILLLISPIIVVLLIIGDDFIGLWMGSSFAKPSGQVLSILLLGYIFALSQLIAQGILKGISKHKVLAYILCIQTVSNLVISIILAPIFGIDGVALGTTIPLLVASIFLIPYFTCKELNLSYCHYLSKAILQPVLMILVIFAVFESMDINVSSFFEVIAFSLFITLLLSTYVLYFQLEREHQDWLFVRTRKIINLFKK